MLVFGNDSSIGIFQVEWQTAELGTFSTIGAALETSLAGIALSAIADAKGTMNEYFQWSGGACLMNLIDFIQRELTSQYDLTETSLCKDLQHGFESAGWFWELQDSNLN